MIPAVALLALAGLGLRVWQLERESFWLDEAGRVAIASLPFGEIAHGVAVVELSPPLYHYLLGAWIRLLGDGDAAVRLLSAALVIPAVFLAWLLGRTLGGPAVGLALAAIVAVNPFAVHYSQEAAMYALLLPLGLATILAAVGVLRVRGLQVVDLPAPPSPEERARRSRWLIAYVILGTLALYTHYFAGFLLVTVAAVGVGYSLSRRSAHGAVMWLAANAAIAIAFMPWLPSLASQAGLAASVDDWSGVGPVEALLGWSGALLADGASGWVSLLALVVAVVGTTVGAWRLRDRGPIMWLLVGLVVVPLALATLASGFFHSFRERGFIVVAGTLWLLIACALFARGPLGEIGRTSIGDAIVRAGLGVGLVLVTVLGLMGHYAERKEDWRSAAAIVAADADAGDPIFFIHFAAQVPFDHYFHALQTGPVPKIGLPASFEWVDGYQARYRVMPADVAVRVPPALAGARHAWAVLSHDGGRGSEHLIAALERWGTRVEEHAPPGVRVLRYEARSTSP